ncbi:hypothetical protein R1flu_002943 [Riccia fluitans]|uniref:CDT1 Geminin-binding domain-containing protein n=1 Tax=Riccia fluitans TaxID=41844 RepID=A0ABD1Y7K2_9MARC
MTQEMEEVSSRKSEMQFDNGIDAVKQSRGMLSFRSRKMLNLLQKQTVAAVGAGGTAETEKKIVTRAATSARDVKLEVVANPPEQQEKIPVQEFKNAESGKSVPEAKKTVRTVVTRRGGGFSLPPKEGQPQRRTSPRNSGGSPPKAVAPERAQPKKKQPLQLPPKLKLLETFYEGLEAAISLLFCRRQMCTLKTVCKTVEQMSKRRFLRSHLAQLKFLFPEAIEIDYVRVPDLDSRRDVWDLRISIKNYSSTAFPACGSPLKKGATASPSRGDRNSQTLIRRKEFHSRLLKFASSHGEDVDVPQDPLPQRPLGGQPLSSPPVSTPSSDAVSHSTKKIPSEGNLDAARSSIGEDFQDVSAEVPYVKGENSEEVYEFSVVKAGHVKSRGSEISSHFTSSFKPHFHGRSRELNLAEKSSDADVGLTSHFAPSFRPKFQETQRGSVTGSGPCEAHLLSSAISSRTIKRWSSSCEGISAGVEEDCTHSLVVLPEGSSSDSRVRKLNVDSEALGEKKIADIPEACLTVREAQNAAASTPRAGDKFLESSAAVIMSPCSRKIAENVAGCSTPASSARGAADSVPNTPHTGINPLSSPPEVHTPAFLSPSRDYYQYSQTSETVKRKEAASNDSAVPPVRTMRSLKFGSPIRPPRPSFGHNQPDGIAPCTPQVGVTSIEGTSSKSTFHNRSAVATPEASTMGESSYLSPLRPQRSRALHFSTPEKVLNGGASSATKSLSSPSSWEQNFKSPQVGTPSGVMKPPRFMSPPKTRTLSAPATPVPPTPVRSILYSPPKRTKFNRGSLFADSEEAERERAPTSHKLEADPGVTLDLPSETPDLKYDLIKEETLITPVENSPFGMGRVSHADLAIIGILPAELVHSVMEKEMKIKSESTKELMLQKKRQQTLASLPKMFNQLRMIFQSMKRSVLPRNELIKNVLSTNADITDRVEVEERLKLLTELAPDWITKQPSANGDFLYRINKNANTFDSHLFKAVFWA